jgi:glycosyltransferase involved in cell wall biosynthesis
LSIIPSSVNVSFIKRWKINVVELQQFLEKFKPDVIHTHLFEAEFVSRFCRYSQAKWFSHMHDNMIQLNKLSLLGFNKTKITNWFERRILFKNYKKNAGTNFIAISRNTQSYINSVQSIYSVYLLHNGIDTKRFQKPDDFLSRNANYSPKPYAVNHQKLLIKIINVGSFSSNKNQQFLIDIMINLMEKGVDINTIFLGSGPLIEYVKNKAKQMDLEENCFFIGNVENVEEYLWYSDVYVHVSRSEALGLTLIEAMAAGLPVITLDGGGNRDLMIDGKNGYLLTKEEPSLFADRIFEVYRNKEMSFFNAQFAKQFDIELYCEKLLQIYKSQKVST